MAMSVKTTGIESLERMLQKLGDRAQDIAAEALFDGVDVIADAYTRAANGIRAERRGGKEDREQARWPTPEEKEAVQKIGVARFDKNEDSVDTSVGPSKRYATVDGKRKPIPLIARAINSGTSFMHKQPVFRRAVSQNRKAARDKIVATAEKRINEIINGK
jgi:hypothetical protein